MSDNVRLPDEDESVDPWPDTEDAAAAHYAACNPEPAERESGKIDR